ncbi:cell wall hydrolase [Afifella sp. IM 167]|uniref:cell wall hydrolase n=1 Tax=Afifella sp. IM 167 TaxID=2033586 RepID=UPI001CCA3AE5|nr:cell wall hydrolase [Afifella sp. IM 167]
MRSASAASLLGICALVAATSPIAYQDAAAMVSGNEPQQRWQTRIEAMTAGTIQQASLSSDKNVGDARTVPVSGLNAEVAIPAPEEMPTTERVNRDRKGDLLMTRSPVARKSDRLPAAGQLWNMDDIFSATEEADLPKVALQIPSEKDTAELMVAYSHFMREQTISTENGILLARSGAGTANSTLVAYAPTDSDIDAPFDAVIGSTPADGTLVQEPRAKPDDSPSFWDWLRGHRSSKPEHSWMLNPLPASVHEDKEQACLARGVYFEARGESELGQVAVAQVILNRVKNPAYPETICGVVYQNKNWRNRCQFSFACDGIRDRIRSASAWASAKKIAADVTAGKAWSEDVGDSTHYHATYVRPRWARSMKKTDRIGRHIFYRTYGGGWT